MPTSLLELCVIELMDNDNRKAADLPALTSLESRHLLNRN
jgi:hypothetical protein